MKKYLMSLSILALAGCSSTGSKQAGEAPAPALSVSEAPELTPEGKKALADEPVRPPVKVQPSQYDALNEAIKIQSDDKIYAAATHILTQTPEDAKALNALAMYHYKRSRFDLAKYLLNKAMTGNPRMAELYSNLGVVHLAQSEQREAIQAFRKALEINRDDVVASSNLGAIYVQEKDFVKAEIVLEVAYRRGVRDARVLNNYAVALAARGKSAKAEEVYKALLKDNSNLKEGLFNYAILLVDNMGKYAEGLEVINRLKFVGGPADSRNKIIALENKAKAGLK